VSLLETHVDFLAALRTAGLPVSLAEGLDALTALERVSWSDRETVRAVYATTLVKRQPQRVTFDAVFDIYWPRMVGDGARTNAAELAELLGVAEEALARTWRDDETPAGIQDGPEALRHMREQVLAALSAGDDAAALEAAVEAAAEAVQRFGRLTGRGPGMATWSAYSTLQRLTPEQLLGRLVEGLVAEGLDRDRAGILATRRIERFSRLVEEDARRRVVEEKGADHMVRATVRPTIDRLDFLAARRSDLDEMRREIYPLARRLAARLAKEQHHRRRGPLDVRRTVRASISTGGVPLTTHHRPRRPHRTELVVLCDVSGSVAHFASFTLMLVYALREAFGGVRAFTFVDDVTEVTEHFRPGADVAEVMEGLTASLQHAARIGRTDYGRAFGRFGEKHADALGPRTSLLILGDARSNHGELSVRLLRGLVDEVRHAWWLNPEHARHWGTGDSAALVYGEVVPMSECRNLVQLGEFVHDIVG
jgi:uncharacterized protein with von Willebrand factor type A (vWA) domain